jgi:Scaffold protein Nfu/NifU N terminal
MGQPVTVIEKASATPGVVRFEINRSITGMGIDRFSTPESAIGPTPAAELARRLFAHGGVTGVTVASNIITVDLADGATAAGLRELIEELFLYYTEGVEVAMPEGTSPT